jgi:hypothetical protein
MREHSCKSQYHIITGTGLVVDSKWPGQPGKSISPGSWGTDNILDGVADLATNRSSTWTWQTGRKGAMYTRRGDPSPVSIEGVHDGAVASGLIAKLTSLLPLRVTAVDWASYALYLEGPDWRLRVSGPWRVLSDRTIVVASGVESFPAAVERIASLNGATVQEVRFQDPYTELDLAFVFDDGRVLELFSEASCDDWLLSIGDLVIEAPL